MSEQEIWNIGKLLKWTEGYFTKGGIESPRLDAEVLLAHVLKKERIYLYVHFDQPLEKEELALFKECIKKRMQRMPVAYIVGEREFMGLPFKVSPAVLVPRPDTEILVEAALKELGEELEAPRVADIGTGSGAIILSFLHYRPKAKGIGVDISSEALVVARENAQALGVANRVDFRLGDMLSPLQGEGLHAIFSNPPYIPREDIKSLEPEVRCFEPMGALDGGEDGFFFYDQLLAGAGDLLLPGGFLALEAGIYQAQEILARAKAYPAWGEGKIIKDLAGIERTVLIWKK